MNERDWRDGSAENFDWSVDVVDFHERNGADFGFAIENVIEGASEDVESFSRRENGERGVLAHVERPNVVESENVIGVGVREEDGVKALEADAKGLLAKIGRGVNNDVLTVAGKQQRRAEAVVTRICGGANTAMTAERRDAHGSA